MNKLKLKLSHNGKNLLLNKLFDLIIVICGVTIAFQLSNLKQKSDQESLESFYLENLAIDIDKDINSINRILIELQSDSSMTSICLSRHTHAKVSSDTLSKAVLGVLSFETFSYRNDNTYSTLVNSQGLSIINNKRTRTLVSEYYKCYKSIDRFEYVYTEFLLNDFNSYFSPYVDYATGKINNPTMLNDVRTNNNLLIAGGQLNDGIETYKNALVKAVALKEALLKP